MSHQVAIERFQRVRSLMETPLLDERKWSKIPTIPADCFILDLEDSVVPAQKEAARERALELLADRSCFGDALVVARPNNIETPWGRADIAALAGAGVELMAYPKARDAAELAEVTALLRRHGADPGLLPVIETAGALLDVRAIAVASNIAGLLTGIGDLSVDARMPFRVDGAINRPLELARNLVAFAAASVRRAATDTLFVNDIRDRSEVVAAIGAARANGFTSLATFYPPHVELVNQLMAPQADEIAAAAEVVELYEASRAAGNPAVVTPDGRTVMALDYQRALNVLDDAALQEARE